MTYMYFRQILLLASFLAGISTSECEAQSVTSGFNENYSVVIILPLTGKAASVGTGIRNGVQLAMESLPGALKERFKLEFEDDGSESKNAVSAFQKFSRNPLDAVISVFSNSGNALAPLTERARIAHISLAVDPQISQGKEYTVLLWASMKDLAQAAVSEAQRRKYRRIVTMTTTHEGNLAMLRALQEAAHGKIELVVAEEILPGESDLRPAVMRLKTAQGIDAVANLLHPSQMGIFAKIARQLGFSAPQFALANFEDSSAVKDAAGALDGQWYVAAQYSEDFVNSYRRQFPSSSILGAAYGHDAIMLLVAALQANTPKDKLARYLHTVKQMKGAISEFSSNEENGFSIPIAVKIVGQDGLR